LLELLDCSLLLRDLLLVLRYLVHDLVQSLLGIQQLSADLARTDLGVQKFLVLLLDLLHVLLVLDLKLVEVDEFQLVAHLLLLCYQVGSLGDLCGQRALLVLVFLDQGLLLAVLLLEVSLDSLGFNVARPAVLPTHKDLPLEVIGILPDLRDRHISLFKNRLPNSDKNLP